MKIKIQEREHELLRDSEGISYDGDIMNVSINDMRNGSYHFLYNEKSYRASVVQDNEHFYVTVNGLRIDVEEVPRLKELMAKIGVQSLAADHAKELKAPMPGKILKVLANKGDVVSESQGIVVLEAMKMENLLKSPMEAEVADILVSEGDAVEKDQILVTFEKLK